MRLHIESAAPLSAGKPGAPFAKTLWRANIFAEEAVFLLTPWRAMKRLIICCDGTWQRLYGGALTNVALTARAVAPRDANGQPQIVYYSAGVGATLSGLSLGRA